MSEGESKETGSELLRRVKAGRERVAANKAAAEEAALKTAVEESPTGFSSVVERQTAQRATPSGGKKSK